jgi:hypothetical protein
MTPGELELNNSLKAGAAKRCISPPPGIAHGTWGAQVHERAEGMDMDLYVNALALDDGNSRAIILDIDIQILINELADKIRQTVSDATAIPFSNIRASATHTHSGPTPYKSWITEGYELVPTWLDNVCRWSAEAAQEAIAKLVEVEVRAARGDCRINVNRRAQIEDGRTILGKEAAKFSDHEVLVVGFYSDAGESIATIVNYACHPTIMGPQNRVITPDYPGVTRQIVENATGGNCLFLLGAAGDQGPVNGFQSNTAVYHRLGEILGYEASKLALGMKYIPVSSELSSVLESGASLGYYNDSFVSVIATPLMVRDIEIFVPLRSDIPDVTSAREAAESAHDQLAKARATTKNEQALREYVVKARRADLKLRLAQDFDGRTEVGVRTHFICMGNIALIAGNIEPFAEIGSKIKLASPFPVTLVSGYTNGRLAYMATAEEWAHGGHEVINSPFGQNAAVAFEEKAVSVLRELHREMRAHAS